MPAIAKTLRAVTLCFSALLATGAHAEGIDTEHLFGFMIGTDVGNLGEREFQTQTTGRFSRSGGNYRAIEKEFELEFVPVRNFRIEMGTAFSSHHISGVPDLEDRRQLAWQGVSVDFRYRFLERENAPFGLTLAAVVNADRVDETTASVVRSYGTQLTLAVEREFIPDVAIATLNLSYAPEWTRVARTGAAEQESTVATAFAAMAQLRPGFFLGGEARYLRRYEGIGLDEFSGQALFVGPTAYFKLSEKSRLTLAWSSQVWGRTAGAGSALDLVNFERHQARVVFGVNF
jgi:hypothetical protein